MLYLGHVHTIHREKKFEPIVTFLANNIMLEANYRSIKPQNGPTPHEHSTQGLHNVPSKAHLIPPFNHTYRRELLSHLNHLALCTT
jgi:hypothetical protein